MQNYKENNSFLWSPYAKFDTTAQILHPHIPLMVNKGNNKISQQL